MPKIYNSMNYAPFSEIRFFASTATIGNLTGARESLHTHNYIDNFELPSSPNHATDIPSSPGDSDCSQDYDIPPDAPANDFPRNDAHSSSDSTFLYIGFTFLHPTPCLVIHSPHLCHRFHRTSDPYS